MKTLTTYEKDIVDHFLIKNANEFNLVWFNHAIANTLPSWRSEQLVNTNDTLEPTQAFIEYKKDLTVNKV
jgi:hypothetical protein